MPRRRAQPEILWAPWRHTFIAGPKPRRCIFCAAKASRDDRQGLVIARGRRVFGLLNLYPYSNGHVMLAPYRHIGQLAAAEPEEWLELFELAQRMTRQLQRLLKPQGYNLGMNIGRAAGAGIPGHRLHIVPRWAGDTNFMTTCGGARVMSQSLQELYRLLKSRPA